MRLFLAVLIAAPALAQQTPPDVNRATETPPPAPVGVERASLSPGDVKAFRLAPGTNHQLLVPVTSEAPGAITISYRADGGQSTIVAINRTGHPLRFTVLADPGGNGGFQPAGAMAASGDGRPASRTWPNALGRINVGDFDPG
jgi:hypothetical protein